MVWFDAGMKKQLTLGEFIFLLDRINKGATVRFDFERFVPTTIDSYRGYYEQLALGFKEPSNGWGTIGIVPRKSRVCGHRV